jgi:phage terminase small subunit
VARGGQNATPAESRKRQGGTKKRGDVSHRPQPEVVTVGGRLEVAPEPPADLPEAGKPIWVELVEMLSEAGMLDRVDLAAVRIAIIQYVQHDLALAAISEAPDNSALDETISARAQSLTDTSAILRATRVRLANRIKSGEAPTSDVAALIAAEERMLRTTERLENLRELRRLREHAGGLVALGSTGQIVEHPLVGIQRAAATLFLRFAQEFGATTLARTRISLGKSMGRKIDSDLDRELGTGRKRKTANG